MDLIIFNTKKSKNTSFSWYKSKVPLIVFGTSIFGKDLAHLKGLLGDINHLLYRAVKKREKEGISTVVSIDKYPTSHVCCKCMCRSVPLCTVCKTQ